MIVAAELATDVRVLTERCVRYYDPSIRKNLDFIARQFELPDRRAAGDAVLGRLGRQSRWPATSCRRCR